MPFKIATTRDLRTADGMPAFGDRALATLKANPDIAWEWVPEDLVEVTPDVAARYDGLHLNAPRLTSASLARPDCRLKIVARHGVGFDSVDLSAATAKGIVVTNTPVAIRRPVAVATLTMIFALAGRLFKKHELVQTGHWNERASYMGQGLTTRTLGLVGAGGIGQELLKLARPFFSRMIVADPYVEGALVDSLGAQVVPLDTLMREADFVVVCCLLNDETRHLINAGNLALMKSSAYYLNMGRGPIHDERALADVLRAGRIAGAGLDVTEREPVEPESPLLGLENTIITPHALCWTDECFHDIAARCNRSSTSHWDGDRRISSMPQFMIDLVSTRLAKRRLLTHGHIGARIVARSVAKIAHGHGVGLPRLPARSRLLPRFPIYSTLVDLHAGGVRALASQLYGCERE
jgi:D-3-phosphoglycerate dehydrogenase